MEHPYKVLLMTMWFINLKSAVLFGFVTQPNLRLSLRATLLSYKLEARIAAPINPT